MLGLINVYKNAFISSLALVSSLTCSHLFMWEYRIYIIGHCMNRGSCMTMKVVDSNIILTFPLKGSSM